MSSSIFSMKKNSKILAVFAVICTAVVGLVNELTKDKIQQQQQLQLLNTLHSIIDPKSYSNDLANDCIVTSSELLGDSSKEQKVYIARHKYSDNAELQPVAMAVTALAPDGYNGSISLIVATTIDGTVSGVRVLTHQETPGLGDKIEERKSPWILSFTGKTLLDENDERWAVAKDNGMFDQFTGATITPRAVVKAVKNAIYYLQTNQNFILSQPNACEISSNTMMKGNEEYIEQTEEVNNDN
ncbi:MAG: electron transport complex subunit RsxG [Colwellia sp.]